MSARRSSGSTASAAKVKKKRPRKVLGQSTGNGGPISPAQKHPAVSKQAGQGAKNRESAPLPPSPEDSSATEARGPRLHSVGSVRRELARLYRQARKGEVSVGDAARLGNLLFLIGRLIEGHELEQELLKLKAEREATEEAE